MTRFLLDENMSPKIAKHLSTVHGMDVLAFPKVVSFGTPDQDVRAAARRLGRVLIMLDSDFSSFAHLFGPTPPGIIWLHPSPTARTIEGEKRILDRFFWEDSATLDLESSILEVTDVATRVLYSKR